MSASDVLVVGGGVIGAAVARELARAGAEVELLERDTPGVHASHAAAGMLTPLAEAEAPGPFLELLRRSRALFPALSADLLEETGIDVEYRSEGTLALALSDADLKALERRYGWQRTDGYEVEWLEGEVARRLEPQLSKAVVAAVRYPDDHQVDNRALAEALVTSAERAGARVRVGSEVARICVNDGRAVGVELAGGEVLAAGAVVLAAGAWAGRVGGLPRPLPVVPVRGQIASIEAPTIAPRHVLTSPRAYLVPRMSGRVIAGATVEPDAGFHSALTPAGMMQVLAGALEMLPSLAAHPLADAWCGFRPGTPDHLPILGPDPEVPNLVYAAGHFRNGILLAPLTGQLIARAVREGGVPEELAPFLRGRIRDSGVSGGTGTGPIDPGSRPSPG